jgi:S1/P1 Nuclease
MRSRLATLAALLLVTCCCRSALAWGGEGHQIVAIIAETHLTPEATAGIHKLLGDDVDISDAEVANWADQIRRERRETGPWHYVNIPINATGYDAQRDEPKGGNIISAIEAQTAILSDKSKPQAERAEALKFIVHLVGDVHQPLHAGDRDDRGGNSCLAWLPDAKGKASNLHAIWDGAMLRQWLRGTRVVEYADKLDADVSDDDRKAMEAGTVIDWANESHGVARDKVYPGVPAGEATRLTPAYVDAARPVKDQQLTRGGIRLAVVLNRAFAAQ